MQLMPSTAANLGISNAYDPEQNIMGAAKMIDSLLTKYNDDTTMALAAYAMGSKALSDALENNGAIPDSVQKIINEVVSLAGEGASLISRAKNENVQSSENLATNLKNQFAKFSNYSSYNTFIKEFQKAATQTNAATKEAAQSTAAPSTASSTTNDGITVTEVTGQSSQTDTPNLGTVPDGVNIVRASDMEATEADAPLVSESASSGVLAYTANTTDTAKTDTSAVVPTTYEGQKELLNQVNTALKATISELEQQKAAGTATTASTTAAASTADSASTSANASASASTASSNAANATSDISRVTAEMSDPSTTVDTLVIDRATVEAALNARPGEVVIRNAQRIMIKDA